MIVPKVVILTTSVAASDENLIICDDYRHLSCVVGDHIYEILVSLEDEDQKVRLEVKETLERVCIHIYICIYIGPL